VSGDCRVHRPQAIQAAAVERRRPAGVLLPQLSRAGAGLVSSVDATGTRGARSARGRGVQYRPCGRSSTIPSTWLMVMTRSRSSTVPWYERQPPRKRTGDTRCLLVCGEHDSFQPPSPTRAQAKALTAARSVTVRMFTQPRTLINAGGVRQAIARCTRAGPTVTCHRVADLDDHTRELIKIKADQWRDGTVERGFSMALGRCRSPEDGCTVVAMSTDSDGELRGLLHFVPWRDNGLWLDLMRRDRTAENGVVEQLVAGVIRDATRLGITQVALNFVVFCSVFARRRTARSRARSAALARRASQPVQVLADRVAVTSQGEVPARMAPLVCF
jgi:Phosphatidylglycerol lysyltransferase, C-terminal